MRIAVLQFTHETVTFLPNETTREDFTYTGSPVGGDALLATDPKGYMGGFVHGAREFDDVTLVGITSPLWPRTGTGSGWVTHDAYEHFLEGMLAELKAGGPFDGVHLVLHGAMAVRGVARPEADIARRVRDVVGKRAFLSGTFDPHGNEDEQFLRHADMGFTVKYFPHYDMHLQGERAARVLHRAIRGAYTPTHATVRVPILAPTVLMWTGASPWSDLVQRALIWEAREPDVYVNVFFGFPWADTPDAGMTIQVMTNGKRELAETIVRDMAQWAWRRREALLNTTKIHTIADGVRRAREFVGQGEVPVVLADYSDRSGHAGWLLAEVMAQKPKRTLIATVAAPEAVKSVLASGARAGDVFDRAVGGHADESAGEPVRVTGRVLGLNQPSSGPYKGQTWVMVSFGEGNVVILSPYLVQVLDPQELWDAGLRREDFDIIAVKSRVHFRRGFDDSGFARHILLVHPPQPFMGTIHLEALPYQNLRLSDYYPYGNPVFDCVIR